VRSINDVDGTLTIKDGQIIDSEESTEINPWDLYALEAAIQCKENYGGELIALSMGTDRSVKSLRRALALGCDQAVLINCSDSYFYDSTLAAYVLKKAIEFIGKPDFMFGGYIYTDVNNSTLLIQLARLLNYRFISLATKLFLLDNSNQTISLSRRINGIQETIQTKYPIILTIDKGFSEPRYPSFMALQKASKQLINLYSLDEIKFATPKSGVKYIDVKPHEWSKIHCEYVNGITPEEKANNLYSVLKSKGII